MSAMPGRNARKSQFHQFKNPERADKPRTSPHLRYNQPLKVATLNVRGLVGENAYLKKAQVVNIMTKFEYDLMLLQETNKNTNSVETIKGFEFFFSTDVKPKDAVQTERAGVAIVVSKELKHFIHNVKQISGRLISITFRSRGRNVSFSSCYAPHSGYDVEAKTRFYSELRSLTSKNRGIHFIGGDFNARLQHRYQVEEPALGPYIFGRGSDYLEQVAECTLENRSLFVDFCLTEGLRVLNTCFRKQPKNYCTFRENTTTHGPEWSPNRYAQLDFWLAAEKWQRNCRDVNARTDIFFPSDHYLVEAVVVVKLQAKSFSQSKVPRFRQPTIEESDSYNALLASKLSNLEISQSSRWNDVSTCVLEAAEQTLTKLSMQQRQEYISRETWQKIEARLAAHESGNLQEVNILSQQIKMLARRDKRRATLSSIRELPGQREKWVGLTRMKKDYQPQFIHMKNLRGDYVAPKDRAEAIATYLETKHWTNESNFPVENMDQIQDVAHLFNTDSFTFGEFKEALSSTKTNKQPGPDLICMELFKWMNDENKSWFLRLINFWWNTQTAPDDLFRAKVIPLYKKGDTDDPSNYRPISLLNSIYKIYMILIRTRLQVVLENTLSTTQYGFRTAKSTSHAIYLVRRMQDIAEQQGSNLIMAFLDWEKAFDKVKHDRLYVAMSRLGVHEHFINVLRNCYTNPCFTVEDQFGKSRIKQQKAGIRQGCPLSPYLFVLVMSVIDHDISRRLDRRTTGARKAGVEFDRIYYADDTVLLTTNTYAANRILWAIEAVSRQFGLMLNREKCSYIAMNGNNVLRFADGTKLSRCAEATYLGHHITESMNVRQEIGQKMHQTLKVWYKLNPFWKAANCTIGWKLQVYDAIIKNKLLYGLETVHLTQAMAKKVNAFQLRGLRSILGISTTFVNRRNTNEFVISTATAKAGREIKLFSDLLAEKRSKLAGHILRSDNGDPLRQVTYMPNSANCYPIGKRRIGGPRQQWRHYTHKYIWENVAGEQTEYENSDRQNQKILQMAHVRDF